MEYIRITKDNLEKEHICCAIGISDFYIMTFNH